jgi:hypothetical protein
MAPQVHPCRDFHRVDLVWPLLVLGIAAGAVTVDYSAASSAGAAASTVALLDACETAEERLHMAFAPIAALLRSSTKSLAFIPWPWDLDTWAQVSGPIVDASPQISAYAMTQLIPFANRSAWEARMSSLYGRPEHVLELFRTSEWGTGVVRARDNAARTETGADVTALHRSMYEVGP